MKKVLAFLLMAALIFGLSTVAFASTATVSDLQGLKDAIDNDIEEIVLDADIELTATITIDHAVTISGGKTLTVAGAYRHFIITANGALTIQGVTLDGNNVGGGVFNKGELTLDGATVTNGYRMNTAYSPSDNGAAGSGVLTNVENAKLNVINSSNLINNTSWLGGVICANDSIVNIGDGCDISGNTAIRSGWGGQGGAMYVNGTSTVNIGASTFSNNTAEEQSGALFVSGVTTVTIDGATFSGNNGGGGGGAITAYAYTATLPACDVTIHIIDATITGNETTGRGGAISVVAGNTADSEATIIIDGGEISGNTAKLGGAIGASNMAGGNATVNIEVNGGTITGNTATEDGGAISTVSGGGNGTTIAVNGGEISGNEAGQNGGAISTVNNGGSATTVTVTDGAITGNTAAGNGGAISTVNSNEENPTTVTINGGEISGNTATTGNSGGIYTGGDFADAATTEVNGGTITGNSSESDEATITVTLNPDNGEDVMYYAGVLCTDPIEKPADPTNGTKIFAGWYTEDNKLWNFADAVGGTDFILTAKWNTPATKTSSGSNGGGSRIDTGAAIPQGIYWIEVPEAKILAKTPSPATKRLGATGIRAKALNLLNAYKHDTVLGKAVMVRVTVPNPALAHNDLLVSGYVNSKAVDATKAIFNKAFKNKICVINLDQKLAWGQSVRIAAKVDLTGMDTKNLFFYSYNTETNTYRQIKAPAYFIDANGYLHFTTADAGEIIVSDGALTR